MSPLEEAQELDQTYYPAFHFHLPHRIGRRRVVDFRCQTLPELRIDGDSDVRC